MKIVIAELEIDIAALTRSMQDTQKQIDELEKKQDKLLRKGKESSERFRENERDLNSLKAAMQAQQAVIDAHVQAIANSAKTFNEFKQQATDAFQSINIFNGGLGGFITRAQEAGGVGPLVSGAFKGMAEGIGGMTRSALAFMATPLGAAITLIAAVLAPVISYFKDTQEGIDKVTAVTRPLQAVFEALVGVFQNVGKHIADAFSNPKKAIEDFAGMIKDNIVNRFTGLLELIPNLSKAIGLLFDGEFSKAGKVAADAVGKVALGTDNITDKVAAAAGATGKFLTEAYEKGQRIDTLQKSLDKGLADYTKRNSELKTELEGHKRIADDTNKSFSERETAALKAVATIKEQNRLMVQRLDQEVELLKLKSSQNGLTDEENAKIAELVAKRKEAAEQGAEAEKAAIGKVSAIRNQANVQQAQQRQKRLEDVITKHRQELDLFVAEGSSKAKTQQEQLKFEQDASGKRMQILKDELNAKKISQTEYKTAVINETNALAQKTAEINIAHGRAALDLAVQQSKSRLEGEKTLTAELINEENTRLENLKNMKVQQIEREKGVNAQTIANKVATNQQLSVEEMEYRTAELAAETEFENQKQANKDAFEAQVKQRDAEKKAVDNEIALAEADTKYEEDLVKEGIRHQEEMARLDQMLKDEKITKDQYAVLEREEAEKTSKIKTQLALQNAQSQLSGMQNVANALGDAFGQSKELAIAQATMSGAQAILSIWSGQITGNPVVDTILKGVLTATTAITTAKQIQSIKSAKKPKQPKFAKGGLMGIGGKRHVAGGTKFMGEDGTAFEAEQGELIGVMNRNAARHFMAFNNAFPAGQGVASGNYFAGGGIVSREMAPAGINTDELAAKIAEANRSLPAPVVAVQDIITEGNSYVQVRDGANF